MKSKKINTRNSATPAIWRIGRELPETPLAVRQQLDQIVGFLCENTGANLIGVYLHGSLAMGCFNPDQSDIDLLMITKETLEESVARRVLIGLLAASGQPCPMEISSVCYAQIVPWRHPSPYDLHFSETHRAHLTALLTQSGAPLPTPGVDPDLAAHFTVLQARGRRLYGAPIADLPLATPWADYLDSLRQDFAWARAAGGVYAVLNACRTWAAVEEGLVFSKAEGAEWAQPRLPTSLRRVVRAAAHCYAGTAQELPETSALLDWVHTRLGWQEKMPAIA